MSTSPAIGNTEITHASIVEVLKETRDLLTALNQPRLQSASFTARVTAQIAALDTAIASMTRPNPDENGFFWWLLAVGFDERPVSDGIDFVHRTLYIRLCRAFPGVLGDELKAKVIGRPDDGAIAKAKGFSSVDEYLAARSRLE